MLIKDQMTPNPIYGHPTMPLAEAQALMQEKNIRHLPILDDDEKLVGLITRRALAQALPDDLSQFGPFVINYTLAKLQAHNIMVRDVVTIDPDITIEEAARIMADENIGCLPVMQDGDPSTGSGQRLVGIITDTDLFNIMLNLLGARRAGVRMTVLQPDRAGEVARLTRAIDERGGYISVFVTYPTADPDTWASVVKVANVPEETLVEAVANLEDTHVQDIRETSKVSSER
jgi:acetoin utilization protein AcuB